MPRTQVTNNVKAYKILFELERLLRNFISETLQQRFEHGWIKRIPPRIVRKCEQRALREKDTYQEISTDDSSLVINYADFKDLKEILINNWPIFEIYFGRRELIENKLEELEIPRNIIAHNRIISTTELSRISVYANDLKRCVGRALTASASNN